MGLTSSSHTLICTMSSVAAADGTGLAAGAAAGLRARVIAVAYCRSSEFARSPHTSLCSLFVLVGPPAEERRVPNDTLPIPSDMARRQTLLLRVALYGQRLTIETAIRSYRAPDSRNCRRFLCLSAATFDSPKPQHHWLRHSVRSVAFADKGGSGIRSTFARGRTAE